MKNAITNFRYHLLLVAFSVIGSINALAQEGTQSNTTESQTSTSSSSSVTPVTADPALWYMQPWAWVAGGVILAVLLYFIFRGSNSSSSHVSRSTTSTTEVKH